MYDLLFYSRIQNRNFLDYWHFSLREKQTVLHSVSVKEVRDRSLHLLLMEKIVSGF